MPSMVFTATTPTGQVRSNDATYATARSGGTIVTNTAQLRAGQLLSGGSYFLYETFLAFDTSGLPAGAVPTGATLAVSVVTVGTAASYTVEIAAFDAGASIDATDWRDGTALAALAPVASIATSGLTVGAVPESTDSGAGLASVVTPTGVTHLVLWSSRQETGDAPTGIGTEMIEFDTPSGTTPPTLTVTYTLPGEPTITSLSPSSTTHGSGDTTLTVTGTDFTSSSVVQWDGAALATTFVSATTLTATIPAADLTNAGTFSITVNDPVGGVSDPATFSVTVPAHVIVPGGGALPVISVSIAGALPDAAPLSEIPVNPDVESIRFGSATPGGFNTLDLGMALIDDAGQPVPYLSEPVSVERRSHIVVRIGGRVVWEGVLTWVSADGRQVQAEGYGRAAINWAALRQAGSDPVDTRVLLSEAINAAPFLVPVEIVNPGGQRTWDEFRNQTPATVLNALTTAGDTSTSASLTFTVYADRETRIVSTVPPDVPDYQVSYDPATMQLGWDYGDLVDGVYVAWTDADGVEQTTDTLYRDGVTVATAVVVVPITASFPDAGAAFQYAGVYLAEHSDPRLSGTIRLGLDDLLTRPDGEQVPGYMVQAGEWITVAGKGTAPITSVSAQAGPVTDQATGATVVVSSVELQVGSPPSTSWVAAQRRALDAAAAYQTMTDPTSGNRRR